MRISFGRFAAAAVVALVPYFCSAPVCAAELRDGTPVPVRLVGMINSETTNPGQPLVFVVTEDVRIGGAVVITRGTPVAGLVTRARRAHWGFTNDKPRLEFRFSLTSARDGQVVALRATPERSRKDRVVVDRLELHHQIRWATGVDTFNAYVDGSYEV